jgi:uncharacterized protein YbjT (DUF2867 family)
MKNLLLVGATGLVGQSVLQLALADDRVGKLVAPTRRPLPAHPKLDNPLVDFAALPAGAPWWRVDSVVCTLGTTMRRAGSPQAFRRVDFDYPLTVARLAFSQGATAYALNSSLGADPHSRVFYSRTKGEVEAALRTIGYPSLTIVRPGLLGGQRGEFRAGERLATVLLTILGPALPRRYRIVPAAHVAAALLEAALAAPPGERIIESDRLLAD